MSPGILSLLCITTLLVFIQTDWLPKLELDLQADKKQILGFLVISLAMIILPSFPGSSLIQVGPGWFPGVFLFFYLLKMFPNRGYLALASISLFTGSMLFLIHEWRHLDPDWGNSYFRIVTFSLLCLISFLFSSRLNDQLLICLGGTGILYGWVMFFHREMLKPLIIGKDEYVDTTWLCLMGIVVAHYSFGWLREWIYKRKRIRSMFRLKEGD
ncbi:hypothetical protein [Hazenella coriacea]|uniref:Uncharacterized protein n=1 Tax=Hazenella coriacea TaxID=1179467 RepID=A0A4R3L3D1_9BACL|nr:hypothetical protein [Hazenella coriacea]TCS93415.1 hypothetical protein EDD58_10762 [Hazenella coriacea]